jgi:hypothetical protein
MSPLKGMPNPFGPKATRVHKKQWYRGGGARIVVEGSSVTPDAPYGENYYFLERIVIEALPPASDGSSSSSSGGGADGGGGGERCRVRKFYLVFFTKEVLMQDTIRSTITGKAAESGAKWIDLALEWHRLRQADRSGAASKGVAAAGAPGVGGEDDAALREAHFQELKRKKVLERESEGGLLAMALKPRVIVPILLGVAVFFLLRRGGVPQLSNPRDCAAHAEAASRHVEAVVSNLDTCSGTPACDALEANMRSWLHKMQSYKRK